MTPALNLVIPPRMGLWPSGAVHENDEGAAFCCEESGAIGPRGGSIGGMEVVRAARTRATEIAGAA